MAFSIDIKVPKFPKDLESAAVRATFNRITVQNVAKMSLLLKNQMVKASLAVKDGGMLANSWQIDPATPEVIGNVVRQKVFSTSVVALVWDKGTFRKNPRPPTRTGDPLRRWVSRKLGLRGKIGKRVSVAISIAIKKRGLPKAKAGRFSAGHFTRAAVRVRPRVKAIAINSRNQFVRELRGGI